MSATTAPGRETRARILEAAWELARDRGLSEVRVADVATAAGVTRQLVYVHFENRAGLLTAMARHRDMESGFVKKVAATTALPPADALDALLRAWLDYIPDILPVARALEAAATTGQEGGAAWHDRMHALRETFRLAVERLHDEGRLADGWSAERAADWIWARSHIDTYHQLVSERGWAHADLVERITRSILGEVAR